MFIGLAIQISSVISGAGKTITKLLLRQRDGSPLADRAGQNIFTRN